MKEIEKSIAPALQNGLLMLEMVATAPDSGVGFNEFSNAAEVSNATTSRLLSVLRARGYVVKLENGRYGPGPRISLFNHSLSQVKRLQFALAEILESLRRAVGNTCLFIYWTGGELQCLDKRTHQRSVPMQEIGHTDPDVTGGPWGWLVYDSLEGDELAMVENSIRRDVDWKEIFQRWKRFFLEYGFCYDDQELYSPLRRLAAPVLGKNGEIIGALALGGNPLTIKDEDVLEFGAILKEHAARLAASI
ncbi:MAG: helix-turn-helix domain-containing protein [Kiritimatiellaeota bacterium]|nr:helix-turn-helix domain-containing protein [Kiritimatiellota bacterium]